MVHGKFGLARWRQWSCSSRGVERRSVTSRHHGNKLSGSQQFFTAICIVERWKKGMGWKSSIFKKGRLIFRLTNLAFLRTRAIPRENIFWRPFYALRGPLHSNSFSCLNQAVQNLQWEWQRPGGMEWHDDFVLYHLMLFWKFLRFLNSAWDF